MSAQPTEPHIGLVVEGAGDKGALPIVLRAHLLEKGEYRDVLGKPIPFNGRGRALVPNGLEGYVATAGARPGCVGVLVVLDGEGDCVAERGVELSGRAVDVVQAPVSVALADRDFEDWLYASAETLGIGLDSYEAGRRGQAMIKSALRPDAYTKTVHQPRLAARMNLDLARSRSVSLDRMLARFDALLMRLPPTR